MMATGNDSAIASHTSGFEAKSKCSRRSAIAAAKVTTTINESAMIWIANFCRRFN
uniref:hypothetical protein n=1 Tax=Chelativorans sp. YIM 93263 TaxID=2906648 RepID=UPI0023786C26|nr:hypothetical protein [Chelativorans sp. YIM 93263]